jgi:chorismate mutase
MMAAREATIACRGIRGAICADDNTPSAIVGATRELLGALIEANALQVDDIASIFFTASPDLDAAYPAQAARELGMAEVSMLCAQEIGVPGAPQRCIRVLVHWNTTRTPNQIEHVYLGRAAELRPDRRWPRPPTESTGSNQ